MMSFVSTTPFRTKPRKQANLIITVVAAVLVVLFMFLVTAFIIPVILMAIFKWLWKNNAENATTASEGPEREDIQQNVYYMTETSCNESEE